MVDGGCVDMEDTNIGDGGVSDLDVAVCRVSGGVQCKLQERREGGCRHKNSSADNIIISVLLLSHVLSCVFGLSIILVGVLVLQCQMWSDFTLCWGGCRS